MKFGKCLLVALALWMPAASFAAAAGFDTRFEHAAPCAEAAAEESSERSELNEMFLPPSVALPPADSAKVVHHDGHRPLDGHIAELHSPPPNPTSPS